MTEQTKRLRDLAAEAKEWLTNEDGPPMRWGRAISLWHTGSDKPTAFIAALDPDTVLGLLDTVDSQEKRIAELERDEDAVALWDAKNASIVTVEARIAAAEKLADAARAIVENDDAGTPRGLNQHHCDWRCERDSIELAQGIQPCVGTKFRDALAAFRAERSKTDERSEDGR